MNVISRLILDFMAKENIIIPDAKSKGGQLFNRLAKRPVQDVKALYYISVPQTK